MNQIFFSKRRIFSKTAESTIFWFIFLDSLSQWESDGATHKNTYYIFASNFTNLLRRAPWTPKLLMLPHKKTTETCACLCCEPSVVVT